MVRSIEDLTYSLSIDYYSTVAALNKSLLITNTSIKYPFSIRRSYYIILIISDPSLESTRKYRI